LLPSPLLLPTKKKQAKEFYLKVYRYFLTKHEFEGFVRLKNGWNDIMQTLFLNIKILNEKQNNWNTYMQSRAVMYSLIN